MSAAGVLERLEDAGVRLEVRGEKLGWTAPAKVSREEVVGLLTANKAELMRLLLERTRTPAKSVVFEAKVEQVPDPAGSVTWGVPAVPMRTGWDGVGEGGVDDDPVVRSSCLASAEACGWPVLALPGRAAERVAGGREAWGLFCGVAEVTLVAAALEVLVDRGGGATG